LNDFRAILNEIVIIGLVPLGGGYGTGKHVCVWDTFLTAIIQYRWTMSRECDYPTTMMNGVMISLHRFCAELYTKKPIPEGMVVDHISPNSILNCLPNNLAIVTAGDNNRNRQKKAGTASSHRCIYPTDDGLRWYLSITHLKHSFRFGELEREEDMAACYNIVMSLRGLRFIPNNIGDVTETRLKVLREWLFPKMHDFGWLPNGERDLQVPKTKGSRGKYAKKCIPPLPNPIGADGFIDIDMSGINGAGKSVIIHPDSWAEVGGKSVCLSRGYPCITVHGKPVRLHIVLWEAANGRKVERGLTINHKDRNKFNATLGNLFEATASEQMTNRILPRKDGLPPGVRRSRQKFSTGMMIAGHRYKFGLYETVTEASHAIRMGHELCRPGRLFWEDPLPFIDPTLLSKVIAEVDRLWSEQKDDIFVSMAMTYAGVESDDAESDLIGSGESDDETSTPTQINAVQG